MEAEKRDPGNEVVSPQRSPQLSLLLSQERLVKFPSMIIYSSSKHNEIKSPYPKSNCKPSANCVDVSGFKGMTAAMT